MDNDLITILIAFYGAIMSTTLAIIEYKKRKPKLAFLHQFEIIKDKPYIKIILTNMSSNSIGIIKGYYHIGKTKKPIYLDIKQTTIIEPQKFIVIDIDLTNNSRYMNDVQTFTFISSSGEKFIYNMNNSIIEELRQDYIVKRNDKIFFELETLSDDIDEAFKKVKTIIE